MLRSSLAAVLLAAAPAMAQTIVAPSLGYLSLNTALPAGDGFDQYYQFNANGGYFYAGNYAATNSSCEAKCCPADGSTTFFSRATSLDEQGASPPSAFFLNSKTANDGDTQKVFLAKDGALAYTAPGGKIPSDALAASFIYQPEKTRLDYGSVTVKGRDFIACKTGTYYQVKTIETDAKVPDGCLAAVGASRPHWGAITAGQYNGGF